VKSTTLEVAKPYVRIGQPKNTGGGSVSHDCRCCPWTPSDKLTVVMAGAWNYALGHSSQPKDTRKLRAAISGAMDYWFNRDITNLACLDHGGTNQCPCTNTSDTTFWYVPLSLQEGILNLNDDDRNRNWYSNVSVS
jgi:hypothetical protein